MTTIDRKIAQALSNHRVDQREVDGLIATVNANGKVSAAERTALTKLLAQHGDKFSAGAKQKLAAFLGVDASGPVFPAGPGSTTGAVPQLMLPPETNPLYSGVPWFAVATGRKTADGAPAYAFFSRGMAINHVPSVDEAGHHLVLDRELFRLGAGASSGPAPVPTAEPSTPKSQLPAWAKNGDTSLLHAPDNAEFLAAMMKQLTPSLLVHVHGQPGFAAVTAGDLSNVKVTYVAQYGQEDGKSGNGRRIAIEYDVKTGSGTKRFSSDISDPFYTDPLHGGRYGFQDAQGHFVHHDPVDHALPVS